MQSHYDTWVDWQDIAPSSEWWCEIEDGIEAAHTFIFVMSPDSVVSKYCIAEAEHAALHHKRIIPIIRRNFPRGDLPEKLIKLQWLYFREQDAFEPAFNLLVEVINTDLEHKKTHTRLEVREIEWLQGDKDASLLLQGSDLEKAEQWLIQASAGKKQKPTEVQGEYIATSRKSYANRQRLITGGLSSLLLVTAGFAGSTFVLLIGQEEAVQRAALNEIVSLNRSAESLLHADQPLNGQ